MGTLSLNWVNPVAVLGLTFLAVFLECNVRSFRLLAGAQLDLLAPIMVYVAMTEGIFMVSLTSAVGGVLIDSLSGNPLGISVLPLLTTGLVVHHLRDLALQDEWVSRCIAGACAGAAIPLMTVLSLLGAGRHPHLGWWSLWQWLVVTVTSGLMVPILFGIMEKVKQALNYQPQPALAFRPDREIKRSRN